VKGFLHFMAKIDAEQCQEAPVSTSKFKGSREVKNLGCTINYDARVFGSSRGKARGPLMRCNSLWVLWAGYVGVFGFPHVFGFCGCFSSLSSFFLFWCPFCVLPVCLGTLLCLL
jgi:hypothetical protein